jgi:hypothetical protein
MARKETPTAAPEVTSASDHSHADLVPAPVEADSFATPQLPALGITASPILLPGNVVTLGAPASTSARAPATPWGAAANAGVSVGRASHKAAVSTAGFFSRLGKKIAGSF